MLKSKPFVLSIGGFDPSLGAGVVQDTCSIRMAGANPLALITGLTRQNHRLVYEVQWVSTKLILQGIEDLKHYAPAVIKISVVQNQAMLQDISNAFANFPVRPKLLWDPVLASTSGFQFWEGPLPKLIGLDIDFMTPNKQEAHLIFGSSIPENIQQKLIQLAPHLTVILKSGDADLPVIKDYIINTQQIISLTANRITGTAHGTGCVFAATISSGLAKGLQLQEVWQLSQLAVAEYIKNYSYERYS